MRDVSLQFAGCAAVIVLAGVLLTRCADKLASATRLSRAYAGLLLLAGATSLPELTVDLSAVRRGSPNLAAGDLLGSSLVNLLILAVLDVSGVSRDKAFGPASRPQAPPALLAALMTALVGLALVSKAGLFVWLLPVVYILGLRAIRASAGDDENTSAGWVRPAAGFAAAAAAIFWAGPRLARAADELARLTGLGQTFIGTTALALATGLPEVVSTITAYRLKAPELAVANILGSNAFNMAIFLPLDLAHDGPLMAALEPGHSLTAFAVLVVSILAALAQLTRRQRPRRYFDPVACGVVLLILGLLRLLASAE